MCSYDLEGVLVYLNSVKNHVDSSTLFIPHIKLIVNTVVASSLMDKVGDEDKTHH